MNATPIKVGKHAASPPPAAVVQSPEESSFAEIHRLVGHTAPVRPVMFSPDGSSLLSAAIDGTVRLWSTETGEQLLSIRMPGADRILQAQFTSDGARIVSCCWGEFGARLSDASTGAAITRFDNREFVRGMAFSADDKIVFTGGKTGVSGA